MRAYLKHLLWAGLLLLQSRAAVLAVLMIGLVLASAVAVNFTTHQTRALYQTQQRQFADLQTLQNERSQLSLEVGALASHARLEVWAKAAGFEVVSEHEVLP